MIKIIQIDAISVSYMINYGNDLSKQKYAIFSQYHVSMSYVLYNILLNKIKLCGKKNSSITNFLLEKKIVDAGQQ